MIAQAVRVVVDTFEGAIRRDGKFAEAVNWFVSMVSIAKV